MNMIRPHCSIVAAAVRRPLQLPVTYINTVVPRGAIYRLDYILVAYNRTVEVSTQTSPELLFRLLNTRGIAHNNEPIPFRDITTPAGGPRVMMSHAWRIEFPPGAVITMEVTGMAAGPVPATVSVTYLGQKGWGVR